jgi:hypothetical protein
MQCNYEKNMHLQFEILQPTHSIYTLWRQLFFFKMDREWMYVGNRVSQHFIEGLETFLETAA